MSKTKFVGFGDQGFWAYDVALGIFLKHLIDAAEASGQADAPWLSEAVPSWRVTKMTQVKVCSGTKGFTTVGNGMFIPHRSM